MLDFVAGSTDIEGVGLLEGFYSFLLVADSARTPFVAIFISNDFSFGTYFAETFNFLFIWTVRSPGSLAVLGITLVVVLTLLRLDRDSGLTIGIEDRTHLVK